MSVLFLDIDGVLNSTSYWHDAGEKLPMGKAGAIDPQAVARLNQIVQSTNCMVVLSSSWRSQGYEHVDKMLQERGFKWRLIHQTPVKEGCPRCAEIDEWLSLNADLWGDRFVVLDDDPQAWSDDGPFAAQGRFVNTNYLVGLRENGVDLAIEWLSTSTRAAGTGDDG